LNEWAHAFTALRLRNRALYPVVLFVFFAAASVAWFRIPSAHGSEALIPTIGGVGGFLYFLYQQHLNETKLFKELFIDFNRRYDALKYDLNTILFDPSADELSSCQREKIFNYFKLCAEEYFFYNVGYIDHDVWQSWCRGMNEFFKEPRIRTLWDQDSRQTRTTVFGPPPNKRLRTVQATARTISAVIWSCPRQTVQLDHQSQCE
jgi:hypothetical protein